MKHVTRSLDKAAALLVYGGDVVEIQGRYPNNTFVVEYHPLAMFFLETLGWLPYKKFCAMRGKIKIMCKDKDGIPHHYIEKPKGYSFFDLAVVKKPQK